MNDAMPLLAARILVVDDEEPNVLLLKRALEQQGYENVRTTSDSREVAETILEFQPDLVLLDLLMPHIDGFGLLEQIHTLIPAGNYLPILVLTADATPETKRRALAAGASDFLTKPFDLSEVVLRIRNMLQTRRLHVELQGQRQLLEERVRTRTRELEQAHIETFERLALAAEYRDDDTGQHTRRVGHTARLVATAMGIRDDEAALIGRAAGLHDVGKIGVPDRILLKPGKLEPEEFEVVKTHTMIGAKILSGSRSPLLRLAEQIALTHHERWDGSGYAGLTRENIPLAGRIATVADVFDALTHVRPYKEAWPLERALEEVADQRGRQFDPDVVDAFLAVVDDAREDPAMPLSA
jgi:response regulator RpfG family c-di-GMP phosphodiesterase